MNFLLNLLACWLVVTFLFTLIGAAFNALFRDAPIRPTRESVACFAREWLTVVAQIPMKIAGLSSPPPQPRVPDFPAEERIPTLLVPGFALNRGSLAPLAFYLHRCGWRWVHRINNQPRSAPIPILARNLAYEVEELCRVSGQSQVDLVGHSMGGIIASYYINELNGKERVRRLVTMGTPWRGTRVWPFGWLEQAKDLRPGSAVIEAARPGTVPTTSIWSHSDALVLPPTSAQVDAATNVTLPHVGHMEMLWNGRVWRAVGEALATAETVDAVEPEEVAATEKSLAESQPGVPLPESV